MSGLHITDGTTTLVIRDPSINIDRQIKYRPLTPDQEEVEARDPLNDGGEIPVSTYKNVTETAEVYFGTDQATAAGLVRTANMLFEKARVWERRKIGGRVWVEFRAQDSDSWYRSELLSGRADLEDGALRADRWVAGILVCTLTFKRRYFWEGPQAYASLTNGGASAVTTITVQNRDDGSGDNWFTIDGSAITGDLPTPARLEITNSWNNSRAMSDVYLGHSALIMPATAGLTLEAENMTLQGAASPSIVTNSGYSNGQKVQWSWSGMATQVELALGYWDLDPTFLSLCNGLPFRLLVRADSYSNLYFQARILIGGLTRLYVGPWVNMTSIGYDLFDTSALPLPPYLLNSGGSAMGLRLQLYARTTAATGSIGIDCVHLFPTESWRVLKCRGFAPDYQARIIDDQIEQALYTDLYTTPGQLGNYTAYGSPIALRPGITNRLQMLGVSNIGTVDLLRTFSVRLAYRPRRLSI